MVPLAIWAHIRRCRMCVQLFGQEAAPLLYRCDNLPWQVILMYCNVMYYTVLYCTALHSTAYCTVLYCIILNCTPQHHHDLLHALFGRGENVSSAKKIHAE